MNELPVLVIACAALGRELSALRQANGWSALRIRCLDATLHSRPADIAPRLRAEIEHASGKYRRILIGYADCGTYGEIDRMLADFPGVQRLPGLHCYELFAGAEVFKRLNAEEPGTFYLTDFLVRFFDRLVIDGLGIGRHPELAAEFFGNYRRMVYLSQVDDARLRSDAECAATRLGLQFDHIHCGYGELERSLAWAAAA